MKRATMTLVTLTMWLSVWMVLAGAEGSCFGPGDPCDGLNEEACLANPECRGVWLESDAQYNGLRCGLTTRCMSEPVFDHCEQLPDCEGLDESECLAEGSCQAVYGYSDTWYANDGAEASPLCAGTRCVEPELAFIECLDASADPCAGLEENECLRRPVCEPLYNWGCEAKVAADPAESPCYTDGETGYAGCQLRGNFCRTDYDCEVMPMDQAGAPADVACYGHNACIDGQCVYVCDTGCTGDWDCAYGERCEQRCGNGWCEGVCVPVTEDCQVTGCPEGFTCEVACYDCAPDNQDCLGGCFGTCVPVAEDCQYTGCPDGYQCQVACPACEPGIDCDVACVGTCVPIEIYCYTDADCPEGFFCATYESCPPDEPGCFAPDYGVCMPVAEDCQVTGCPAGYTCEVMCEACDAGTEDCLGACVGTCVPVVEDCQYTGCPEGYECQVACPDCAPGTDCEVACVGTCVPVNVGCTSDAECGAGQVCVIDAWCGMDETGGVAWCGGTCMAAVWMVATPVQCEQTAWELDAEQFPENYAGCMVDCGAGVDCGTGWAELCVLQTFLAYQGVTTHDARNVQGGDTCAACGCPRGNELFVLVAERDIELLFMFGFNLWGAIL